MVGNTTERCDALRELEMTFSFKEESFIGDKDYNEDFNVHQIEISFDDEETWSKKINKLKKELENRKKQHEI